MRPKCVMAWLLIVCLALLAMVIVACGGNEPATTVPTADPTASTTASTAGGTTATSAPASEEKTFTAAELAEFDGKEGRPAYIAVDGVVYDVSASVRWPEGGHTACFLDAKAGNDLSQELERAPSNMRALVERLPAVGRLEQ